jgi:hypothetical protein
VQFKAKSGFDILDFLEIIGTEANCPPQLFFPFFRPSEFEKGKTFALPESKRLSWNFILFFIEAKILPLEGIEKSNLVVNSEDRVPVLKFRPSWGIGESQAQ